jgi:LysR family hydrogen peroxide-inducible transcriptional activator
MNLRDLRYFVSVAERRSFSSAAEHCAVTQSTLSIQLRKLEDYLGAPLVRRDLAPIALTEAGERVLPIARDILRGADQIVLIGRSVERQRAADKRNADRRIDEINRDHPART